MVFLYMFSILIYYIHIRRNIKVYLAKNFIFKNFNAIGGNSQGPFISQPLQGLNLGVEKQADI